METTKIIIVIISVISVIVVVGIGIYYLVNHNFNFAENVIDQVKNGTKNAEPNPAPQVKQLTPEEIAAQNKKNFAETITGTISFSGKTGTVKAAIKTSDGKEYIISPYQPEAIYGSFGVENGDEVQIQGRFIEDNKIEWVTMKPILK